MIVKQQHAPASSHDHAIVLPRAVTVHSLAQARAALATGQPVTLLSAPGAAGFAGIPWWRALIRESGVGFGRLAGFDMLDCGADGGAALEALRAGQRRLVLTGRFALAVAEAAASIGAEVFDCRPPSLDLGEHGAERHLLAWLSDSASRTPSRPRDRSGRLG